MSPDTPCELQNKFQFHIKLYFCRRSLENLHSISRSTFQVNDDHMSGLKSITKCTDEWTKIDRANDKELTSGVTPEFCRSPLWPVKSYENFENMNRLF